MVERKNRTLEEIARMMLCENILLRYLCAEVVNTACYILNRTLIRPILMKTPYELWKDRKLNLDYFHAFGCKCFIHNNGKDNLKKFDPKSDEGIFLGYSTTSKAFRVFNKRTLIIKENIHVVFDESRNQNNHPIEEEENIIEDKLEEKLDDLRLNENNLEENVVNDTSKKYLDTSLPKDWRYASSHPKEIIIGDI